MFVLGRSVEVLLLAEILWTLVAAWLFPGLTVLVMSVRDPGFYGPTVALALGVIAVATAPIGGKRLLVWLLVGLLAGLALWTSPMSAALAAPS